MESKEIQKNEEINISTESKPQTKSQGVQTSEKFPEQKNPQNNFYISYKDLFINTEQDKEKEKEKEKDKDKEKEKEKDDKDKVDSNKKASEKKTSKNEEDIKMIHQLFNIPISDQDSFKNKDFKFRFQNNKNIIFVNEFTVKYIGKGISKIDYGIVQTEKEILNKRPIFYFEANIINDGEESDLLIGIGEKDITEKSIQLGLTTHSYGYHSKGKSYNNKKSNKYAETYKKGDIIGCGVDFINQSIFYTKNGKFLDFAFKEINFELNKGFFYPSICMHSLNTEVKLNFGNENFKFDINNYYENILINKYNILQSFNPKYDDMDYLVKEYLFHEGYMNTFRSMIKNEKKDKPKNKSNEDNKMDEDDNDDLYLNIDDNLKIEETKNNIIIDDAMDIEDDNIDNENDENLIDNIIELLPKENIIEENKDKNKDKEKEKEKTDSNKKDKKEDKKEDKKDEKKDEKKSETEVKMDIEEKKEDKDKAEKEKAEKEKAEKEKLEKEKAEKEKAEKEEKEKKEREKIELEKKKKEMQKFISLRKKITTYLTNKEFDKAILLLKEKYSNIKEKEEIYKKLFFNIVIMKYLTLLSNENNYIKCFELIDSLDKEYWDKFKILLYENSSYNKTSLVSLQTLATLISQPDITNSDYSFYLSDNQINLIKHQINSLLFELINLSPLSNLNKISAQLEYMNELYYKVFNCNQELNMKLE